MFTNVDFDFLVKFIDLFTDEVFITDFDGNILQKNRIAAKNTPKIKNICKIAPQFDFEICILKSEDIMVYTPIKAALFSNESFFANVSRAIKPKIFEECILTSFVINNNKKLIIVSSNSAKDYLEKFAILEEKTKELEEKIANTSELKNKIENNLLRTNLMNLIADKISKHIETKKILKILFEQIHKTIEIHNIDYVHEYSKNQIQEVSDKEEKQLFVPITKSNKKFGAVVLSRKCSQQNWQKEEIDLLKNLSALLATAFVKEELYEQLKKQKTELENALKQLKNAQLQIVQSEKLATLGQLVAGVAHEINTPLGAISSNLSLLDKLARKTNKAENLAAIIEEITPINNEAIRRIENLVKSLKNFTRLDEAKKKKVDITEGILSSIELIAHETKNKLDIVTDLQKLPLVSCYPDYINQVFMNILLNACQSIKTNGKIQIKTEVLDQNVIVTISDNGCGIDAKNINKIFEFGYTTKKIGQGTGLGLALAKKIIDEHNGKIEVISELKKGTTFKIYLPV